jgi:hypothetical protein
MTDAERIADLEALLEVEQELRRDLVLAYADVSYVLFGGVYVAPSRDGKEWTLARASEVMECARVDGDDYELRAAVEKFCRSYHCYATVRNTLHKDYTRCEGCPLKPWRSSK